MRTESPHEINTKLSPPLLRRGRVPKRGTSEVGWVLAGLAMLPTLAHAQEKIVVMPPSVTLSSARDARQVVRLLDVDFKPGEESLDVELFEEARIPWKDIAFRTVGLTLKHWFADRARNSFGFHSEEIK